MAQVSKQPKQRTDKSKISVHGFNIYVCFGVYVPILVKRHPDVIGDMMAYIMITIMRAQIEFEDPVWRTYDEAYRDEAATTGNRKWSEIDPHLYNKIFTGRAKKMAICSLCGNQ